MDKPLGVLMFLLVIPKVLGTADADCSSTCSPSVCSCINQGLTSVPQNLPTTITELNLALNQITTLSQPGFSQYESLVKLWLYRSQITGLPSDIFTGLGNLQQLRLDENDISEIQAETFDPTSQLRTLDLSNNKLTTLRPDMFTGLGNLVDLDLTGNDITNIRVGTFNPTSQLKNLGLHQNKLTSLVSGMFTGLGNLINIYLYYNDISDIQDGTFSSTPEMRELYLQHNKLKRLRADMFTGLGKLEILRLYANDISDIQAGTFSSMLQLKVLYLYDNKLKSLRPDMFTGLGNLQELHLQNNEITDIYLGTFSPMPNVNGVQLFANRITIFPFEYLSDIQTLSTLYLDNNQMTTLPSVAYDILSSIADVQMHNNPWQCDCRMVEFRLKMTKSRSFDEPITCSQPDNLSGRNLIDVNPKDLMTGCQKPNIARFARIGNRPLVRGQTLRLVCEASGIPTPEITVAPPSGNELNATEESGGRVTVWPNGTVVVRVTVTADGSGRYVCFATNSVGSTSAVFYTEVIPLGSSPTFSLPTLNILYLIAAVAGTLVIVAIVLAIWCKCCRKDRPVAVGPDTGVVFLSTGPPAVMYSGHGARVAWGHPMAMSRV